MILLRKSKASGFSLVPPLSKKRTHRDISLVHSSLWWPWYLTLSPGFSALEALGSCPDPWVRTLGSAVVRTLFLEYFGGHL